MGWREWVSLPDLGVEHVKCKVDTGARTSALHAFFVEPFEEHGRQRVRFGLHPYQRDTATECICVADVVDRRRVSDSGGHREMRWVIRTRVGLMGACFPVETTLTDRETMLFRMLLGRSALRGRYVVDPSRSFLGGRPAPRPR